MVYHQVPNPPPTHYPPLRKPFVHPPPPFGQDWQAQTSAIKSSAREADAAHYIGLLAYPPKRCLMARFNTLDHLHWHIRALRIALLVMKIHYDDS